LPAIIPSLTRLEEEVNEFLFSLNEFSISFEECCEGSVLVSSEISLEFSFTDSCNFKMYLIIESNDI
jgi:hypothetical protein